MWDLLKVKRPQIDGLKRTIGFKNHFRLRWNRSETGDDLDVVQCPHRNALS